MKSRPVYNEEFLLILQLCSLLWTIHRYREVCYSNGIQTEERLFVLYFGAGEKVTRARSRALTNRA